MLYSTNTPMAYTPQPTYIDAYNYAGGTSGYNRANATGWESGVSNAAGGVLGSIPGISTFYNLGSSAYKGLKSTDTGAGDFFGNIFGPHHQLLSNLDNSKELNKRQKRLQFVKGADGKMTYAGNIGTIRNYEKDKKKEALTGMQTLLGGLIGSSLASTIEGKADRQKEQDVLDYNKKLQNYYQEQTGIAIPSYEAKDATPYNSSITQGLVGGVTGLFQQYGGMNMFGKKDNQSNGQSQPAYYQGTMEANPSTIYDPSVQITPQGDNMNWSAGTYGFEDGGVMVVGGKGKDDIALVDTTNGQDTGVRVAKDEMLVISKENVGAIEDALEKGDKQTIYDIIRKQFKEEPKEMDDEKVGFAGGGIGSTDDSASWFYQLSNNNSSTPIETIYGQDVVVDGEHPEITQSLYESNVPVNGNNIYDKLKNIDLGSIAGSAYDGYRYGMGMQNASKELPRWTLPTDYLQYGQILKSDATRGLTPEELALLNTTANENMQYGMANVYNLAGGNAGLALANINNLGSSRLQDAIKINALDAERQRANQSTYGNYLKDMNSYDRQQYLDRLSQDERTKMAAAQLAQDAYKNMENRVDYNKTYGNNSLYSQLEQEYLKQKQLETIMKQNYINSLK